MNVYDLISKRVGYAQRQPLDIPSLNDIKVLIEKSFNNDTDAYTKLVELNRFARAPQNREEEESLIELSFAFISLKKKYQGE